MFTYAASGFHSRRGTCDGDHMLSTLSADIINPCNNNMLLQRWDTEKVDPDPHTVMVGTHAVRFQIYPAHRVRFDTVIVVCEDCGQDLVNSCRSFSEMDDRFVCTCGALYVGIPSDPNGLLGPIDL